MRMKSACRFAGRNPVKGLGLEQRGHPVVGVGAPPTRGISLSLSSGAGLVPGDHDVKQIGVDGDDTSISDRHAP